MIILSLFVGRRRLSVALTLFCVSTLGVALGAVPADRLTVTSTSFTDGGSIPGVYAYRSCAPRAENRSPQLSWKGAPAGTKSFAVTMFDPDAPTGHGFWHWVMFNIPVSVHGLAAGAGSAAKAPPGAVAGHSDFGSTGYGGPCPPPGDKPHHYVITVRALDVALMPGGNSATSGPQLLAAIAGHVLAEGKIVGRFAR